MAWDTICDRALDHQDGDLDLVQAGMQPPPMGLGLPTSVKKTGWELPSLVALAWQMGEGSLSVQHGGPCAPLIITVHTSQQIDFQRDISMELDEEPDDNNNNNIICIICIAPIHLVL